MNWHSLIHYDFIVDSFEENRIYCIWVHIVTRILPKLPFSQMYYLIKVNQMLMTMWETVNKKLRSKLNDFISYPYKFTPRLDYIIRTILYKGNKVNSKGILSVIEYLRHDLLKYHLSIKRKLYTFIHTYISIVFFYFSSKIIRPIDQFMN